MEPSDLILLPYPVCRLCPGMLSCIQGSRSIPRKSHFAPYAYAGNRCYKPGRAWHLKKSKFRSCPARRLTLDVLIIFLNKLLNCQLSGFDLRLLFSPQSGDIRFSDFRRQCSAKLGLVLWFSIPAPNTPFLFRWR